MTIDIAAERVLQQEIFDNPQSDMERSIKRDWLDGGSEPREWSDETVSAAYWTIRIYAKGWEAYAAALRAPVERQAPEGWKLVPIEPTLEMTHAGQRDEDGDVSIFSWQADDCYRAMLSAAPSPPGRENG